MDSLRPGPHAGDISTVAATDRPQRQGHWLAVIERERSLRVELPAQGELVVGRADDAGVRLEDSSVSRRHARLIVRGDRVSIVDLGSQNGTRVNGAAVVGERQLSSRDVIALGEVTLVVYTQPSLRPPPAGTPARTLELADRAILVADAGTARAYALIERLAPTPLPVLIHGETGSGKECAAQALHHLSPRRAGPFVALNCAAIPETLVESELFGHAKGAFSGAQAAKPGLLERADGGTLFLDEVCELAAVTQAKLLRVLETRRLVRVGEVEERGADLRLVAATNRDLEAEVTAKRFREDLYFRLCGAVVWLPPLRERPRELMLLAHTFVDEACVRAGRPALALAPETQGALAAWRWPGNVRELRHVMEYAVAAAEADEPAVLPRHLPERLAAARPASAPAADAGAGFRSLDDELRELEARRLHEALAAAGGNKTRAAQLVGLARRTFVEKLKGHLARKKP